jgi:hypothetical protein
MEYLGWLGLHWQECLVAFNAALVAGIAVAVLVPGNEPEHTLQKIVDIIAKFSKK